MKRTLMLLAALSLPALFSHAGAHELIQSADGKVAALVHIEPDDDPIAGNPSTVWFELTQRGGQKIALSSCTCTLKIYQGAYKAGAKPLLTPKLTLATSGEGKGNPNGAVTFPAAGAYTLVLEGKPKAGATFPAFRITTSARAEKKG